VYQLVAVVQTPSVVVSQQAQLCRAQLLNEPVQWHAHINSFQESVLQLVHAYLHQRSLLMLSDRVACSHYTALRRHYGTATQYQRTCSSCVVAAAIEQTDTAERASLLYTVLLHFETFTKSRLKGDSPAAASVPADCAPPAALS
jgi:hypothetical protein